MDFTDVIDAALKNERDAARRVIELLHMQFIAGTDVDQEALTERFDSLTAIEMELLRRGILPSDPCMRKSVEASQMVRAIRLNEVPGQNQQEEHLLDLEPPREKPYRPIKEKIPVFEAGYVDYAIFKLIFDRLVHNNANYDVDEKATLLLEHVKGAARKIILPYLSRSGAYQLMYAALESVYTKDDLLKEHLKKDIETLPKMNGKSDVKLTDFKNEVSRITNTVEMCTQKGDDFRRNSYVQVISKFDDDTKLELARKCSDLAELVTRLEKWCIAKERMDIMNIGVTATRPTKQPEQVRSAVVHTSNQCVFCNGVHHSRNCHSETLPGDRRKIAQEQRLCFVCLEAGHRLISEHCPLKGQRCAKCNGYHHQSICFPRRLRKQQSGVPNSHETVNYRATPIREPKPLNNAGAVMFESFTDNSPYLRATVNGQPVRILLDTGSDQTFIARHLLQPRDIFRDNSIVVSGIGGIAPCDEVSEFFVTGPGISPIGFYGYVMNQLANTDIIIGRFDIPSLLKEDVAQGKKDYFDTVFGPVRYSQPEPSSRVASSRVAYVEPAVNLKSPSEEMRAQVKNEPKADQQARQLSRESQAQLQLQLQRTSVQKKESEQCASKDQVRQLVNEIQQCSGLGIANLHCVIEKSEDICPEAATKPQKAVSLDSLNMKEPKASKCLHRVRQVREQLSMKCRTQTTDKNIAVYYSRPKSVGQSPKTKPCETEANNSPLMKSADEKPLPRVNFCYEKICPETAMKPKQADSLDILRKCEPNVSKCLPRVSHVREELPKKFRTKTADPNIADSYSSSKTVGQSPNAKPCGNEVNNSPILKQADEKHLPKVNFYCEKKTTQSNKRVKPRRDASTSKILQRMNPEMASSFPAMTFWSSRIPANCVSCLQDEARSLPMEREADRVVRQMSVLYSDEASSMKPPETRGRAAPSRRILNRTKLNLAKWNLTSPGPQNVTENARQWDVICEDVYESKSSPAECLFISSRCRRSQPVPVSASREQQRDPKKCSASADECPASAWKVPSSGEHQLYEVQSHQPITAVANRTRFCFTHRPCHHRAQVSNLTL